jgi:hypothetical protein
MTAQFLSPRTAVYLAAYTRGPIAKEFAGTVIKATYGDDLSASTRSITLRKAAEYGLLEDLGRTQVFSVPGDHVKRPVWSDILLLQLGEIARMTETMDCSSPRDLGKVDELQSLGVPGLPYLACSLSAAMAVNIQLRGLTDRETLRDNIAGRLHRERVDSLTIRTNDDPIDNKYVSALFIDCAPKWISLSPTGKRRRSCAANEALRYLVFLVNHGWNPATFDANAWLNAGMHPLDIDAARQRFEALSNFLFRKASG